MPIHLAGILEQQGAGGGAGIAFVGAGTWTSASSSTSLALNIDPGDSSGDLLIAVVTCSNDESITPPSGWTELHQTGAAAGDDNQLGVWYRTADGTEGATESWSTTSALNWAGICVAYSGVSSVADTSANWIRSTDQLDHENYTGTLPTVASGDWLVSMMGLTCNNTSTRSITEPSGTTSRYKTVTTPHTLGVADEGPLSSAPAAADWAITNFGSTRRTISAPVLLKA